MKTTRRTALARLAALPAGLGAVLASPQSRAQAFADRPIRLIAPYAAGGSADTLARALAELMRKDLGQTVVVENKPGANTAVGAQFVAAAPPDGYTLLLCTGSTVVTNPMLYPKLVYNPERDLAPVARIAVSPLVVAVNPAVPANSLAELVRLARAQPGKLNYASTGTGSVIHLASLFLESQAGLDMAHIPFNGSTPALAATLAGDVQLFVDAISSSLPHIKAGKLRALAVTTAERLTVLPDLPTVAESGFAGFDVSAWYGIMAPAKTPPAVIASLNASIGKALLVKSFRDQFEAQGLVVPAPTSAPAYADYIRRERDKWGPLIKAKKISLD
ncbi:MAG TPA: tripartite tricarboxylate transporter substrate binding protein [Burkholderiaceae bacterium]|nr:tripartite tricarboxylate transporter substrate binding protein [Burkholderiaceae bacterium]